VSEVWNRGLVSGIIWWVGGSGTRFAKWSWNRRPSTGSRYGCIWNRIFRSCTWRRRNPTGRPKDGRTIFRDAQRLARRLLAGELMLSFVPEPEQRTWRLMTRGRLQLVRDRVRLQNQVEALREEARIKLSSVISDLLGVSGRRILPDWA
jgi:hypothetical protein